MSIDARVRAVHFNEDGSGKLNLIDRPAHPGGTPGCAGQSALHYDRAPHEVTALNGLDIWGGSEEIILGDIRIAKRVGYTRIEFVDDETFKRAVTEYHKKRRAPLSV
jgi:hypothetical protein